MMSNKEIYKFYLEIFPNLHRIKFALLTTMDTIFPGFAIIDRCNVVKLDM